MIVNKAPSLTMEREMLAGTVPLVLYMNLISLMGRDETIKVQRGISSCFSADRLVLPN